MKHYSILALFIFLIFSPTLVEQFVYAEGNIDLLPWVKLLVHFGIPLAFAYLVMRETPIRAWQAALSPWPALASEQRFRLAAILSTAAFGVIVGAYFALGQFVDLDGIAESLANNGVTKEVYPWMALWIVLVNPFKEEFFWRGFVFRRAWNFAQNSWQRHLALYGTGILFAVHHIIIFIDWFNWWQFLLATTFLSVAGIILNYLYLRAGSIWAPFAVHAAADIALAALGFVIFGYL
jgi:membrane protease YdiL (CAAX protease family)